MKMKHFNIAYSVQYSCKYYILKKRLVNNLTVCHLGPENNWKKFISRLSCKKRHVPFSKKQSIVSNAIKQASQVTFPPLL